MKRICQTCDNKYDTMVYNPEKNFWNKHSHCRLDGIDVNDYESCDMWKELEVEE